MNSRTLAANSLHLDYALTDELRAELNRWDALVSESANRPLPHRWDLAIQPSLRSATVAGSTGIEGNPLSAREVADVLAGGNVADRDSQREVLNYNEAMDVATTLAGRPDFSPEESLIQLLNAIVTRGTDVDTHGLYRTGPVSVGGAYTGPNHVAVPGLMAALVQWWRSSEDHPLIRSAIVHVNVAAIHPWDDGNGRTARILSSLVIMHTPLRNPEAISLESYFRVNRDDYFHRLAACLGQTYQPDRHSVTEWLEYYVRVSVLRLVEAGRLFEDVRRDMGTILSALEEAGDPAVWAPILFAATLYPLETAAIARIQGRSEPTVRRMLGEMVARRWLRREGITRGTRYHASDRLSLSLRTPALLGAMSAGYVQMEWATDSTWTEAATVGAIQGAISTSE